MRASREALCWLTPESARTSPFSGHSAVAHGLPNFVGQARTNQDAIVRDRIEPPTKRCKSAPCLIGRVGSTPGASTIIRCLRV